MDIYSLLRSMTLEEKLGQLTQLHCRWFCHSEAALTGPETELSLRPEDLERCGSVLNFMGAEEMLTVQREFLARSDRQIPLLFMQNVVHGHRTIYPIPLAMGGSFDPELLQECCDMAAREAAASGVHVNFAPMLDLVRDARWGRVMESTGEDPYLNGVMAQAFVRGFQGNFRHKHNMAVCIKHFAAYGAAEAGRDYNAADIGERSLRQYYLPAYKAAIDAGAEMVMASFNTLDGVPVTGSDFLLNQILREEYGFDKVLISDFDAVRELIAHGYCADEKEAALQGIRCNVDIEMMSATYYKYARQLLEEGRITMAQIDRMVLRVLRLKQKMHLFERPTSAADTAAEKRLFCCKKHRAIARRAAQESVVLLKNANGVLPLKREDKIALIGPFADTGEILGNWNGIGVPEETVTLYQGMRRHTAASRLRLATGCGYGLAQTDDSGFAEALRRVRYADKVVLAIGEHQAYSGEGRSRAHITIPPLQMALARAVAAKGKPVIAVVFAGRPLELEELTGLCDAVVYAWQPGTEGGSALADILYGAVNPSGKLAMSLPYAVGQLPLYYNALPTGRPKKGDAVPQDMARTRCCSMYGDVPNRPLYPFGYGLSYTTFAFSDLRLSADRVTADGELTASVTVTNTGSVAGKEVVQLYVRDCFASVSRPVRELKGFQKILLQPGESRTVNFVIREEMLRFWNQAMQFVSEPGEFTVYIGNSSDAELSAGFWLE